MAEFFVGTSGWNYGHWQYIFYPEGLSADQWLRHYAAFFNAVELNVTFYRSVRRSTFEKWYKETPEKFRFAVKGSRFITHIKRLKDAAQSTDLFFENALALAEKLGVVLWQFPPSFKKELKRLEVFLRRLKKTKVRQAFEFRHASWFDDDVYALLKEYGACLCIAHSGSRYPCVREVTADFLYLRFHGQALYSSFYPDEELKEWAASAKEFCAKAGRKNKDLYAFFNNDAYGYAVKNALTFKKLMKNWGHSS